MTPGRPHSPVTAPPPSPSSDLAPPSSVRSNSGAELASPLALPSLLLPSVSLQPRRRWCSREAERAERLARRDEMRTQRKGAIAAE